MGQHLQALVMAQDKGDEQGMLFFYEQGYGPEIFDTGGNRWTVSLDDHDKSTAVIRCAGDAVEIACGSPDVAAGLMREIMETRASGEAVVNVIEFLAEAVG